MFPLVVLLHRAVDVAPVSMSGEQRRLYETSVVIVGILVLVDVDDSVPAEIQRVRRNDPCTAPRVGMQDLLVSRSSPHSKDR